MLLLVQDMLLLGVLQEFLILLDSIHFLELLTLLLELLNEAAVLQVSLEGLNGGSPVREPSDRREALHGQMKGVTVLIAGSEKGAMGSRHKQVCTQIHTCTHTHVHET